MGTGVPGIPVGVLRGVAKSLGLFVLVEKWKDSIRWVVYSDATGHTVGHYYPSMFKYALTGRDGFGDARNWRDALRRLKVGE